MKLAFISGFILVTISLSAQQITRIATIDYVKILTYSENDSLVVKNYQQEKNNVQNRLKELKEEIKQLAAKQLTAEEQQDKRMTSYYQRRIKTKNKYLDSYLRNQVRRLTYLQQQVLEQNQLAFELQKAIELTAREQGIAIVLNKDDPSIIWVSPDIDLTVMVLQRLKKQLALSKSKVRTSKSSKQAAAVATRKNEASNNKQQKLQQRPSDEVLN